MSAAEEFSFCVKWDCFKSYVLHVFHVEQSARRDIRHSIDEFLFWTIVYFWLNWMNAYTECAFLYGTAGNCILYGSQMHEKINEILKDEHAIQVELSYGYIRIFCKKGTNEEHCFEIRRVLF